MDRHLWPWASTAVNHSLILGVQARKVELRPETIDQLHRNPHPHPRVNYFREQIHPFLIVLINQLHRNPHPRFS